MLNAVAILFLCAQLFFDPNQLDTQMLRNIGDLSLPLLVSLSRPRMSVDVCIEMVGTNSNAPVSDAVQATNQKPYQK